MIRPGDSSRDPRARDVRAADVMAKLYSGEPLTDYEYTMLAKAVDVATDSARAIIAMREQQKMMGSLMGFPTTTFEPRPIDPVLLAICPIMQPYSWTQMRAYQEICTHGMRYTRDDSEPGSGIHDDDDED